MAISGYQRAIKEWPEDERPRERLMKLGAVSLSEAQLLAIVLATGDASTGQSALDLARNLLQQFEGLRGNANIDFHVRCYALRAVKKLLNIEPHSSASAPAVTSV